MQPRSTRLGIVAAAFLVIALAVFAYVWWNGRPVALADVPGGRVHCISYNPADAMPWENKVASLEQVRADLQHLSRYTQCVRTYSVSNGLDQVPQVARELGLKVMLGIWIGKYPEHNEEEMKRGLELIASEREVIESVVVGNEVLLRREQTPDGLRSFIRRVRAATDLPVTYADVWEFWLENTELSNEVSFVTVHMLPYWEDIPTPIEGAVQHIGKVLAHVQKAFPDKRIFIGEAGWPSFGRQRAGAVPSLVNEARFFREFTAYAQEHDVGYNFIEAFDQPWKRALEGTVGGKWGLFDAHSRLKFPLTGAVRNDPEWRVPLSAAVIATVVVGLGLALRWRKQRAWQAVALAALGAYSAGALAVLQWRYLLAANRNAWEWMGSVTWFASGWVVSIAGTWLIVRAVRDAGTVQPLPSAGRAFAEFVARWHDRDAVRALLSLARLVFLFGLAYVALLLTLDSRYRDFPLMAIVLPVAVLWSHAFVSEHHDAENRPLEELLLCYWLSVASVWVLLAEGFRNIQSLAWCAFNLWVALTLVWHDRRARNAERTEQETERREFNAV